MINRPWCYTHANLELPAITEAVESGNWQEAQRQTEFLMNALNAETALMRRVAAVLQPK